MRLLDRQNCGLSIHKCSFTRSSIPDPADLGLSSRGADRPEVRARRERIRIDTEHRVHTRVHWKRASEAQGWRGETDRVVSISRTELSNRRCHASLTSCGDAFGYLHRSHESGTPRTFFVGAQLPVLSIPRSRQAGSLIAKTSG